MSSLFFVVFFYNQEIKQKRGVIIRRGSVERLMLSSTILKDGALLGKSVGLVGSFLLSNNQ